MKLLFLDFEFCNTAEPSLTLVCMSAVATDGGLETHRRDFWLAGGDFKAAARFLTHCHAKGYVLVAYALEAEARSLLTLFRGTPPAFRGLDLYLEYRSLLNHNHGLAYGKQLIDGKVKTTKPPPPKWQREESDEASHDKPSYGLAAACYKLLDVRIDTVEKDEVREIIISADFTRIKAERERIQRYCAADVEHLPRLLNAVWKSQQKSLGLTLPRWLEAAYTRADYATRTARMTAAGYPVNTAKLGAFQKNTHQILKAAAEDCVAHLPGSFRFDKKFQRYAMTEKVVREWVTAQARPYWRHTDKKALSLSRDAFYDWYDSESDGFAGAFCRYLKTKQSLNGFLPGESKRGKFTDYLGSDGRVRPYFGIYGSQSSRSQPGAVGFIPLKAHWMRNFIEAPAGRALCGIDYASQEFLIAAVLSQDRAMMEAYTSGDVYLAFAKAAKLAPADATKQSHEKVRNLCKALVLGISYDMSPKGLAPRLEAISGESVGEDKAEGYIDTFFDIYSDYAIWKRNTLNTYRDDGCLTLPDGWPMHGDNDNMRSVGNFPIQGHGAVIMREAVRRAQDCGLLVVFTLHDALYIELNAFETHDIRTLMACMQDAYRAVMGRYGVCPPIRLEGEAWSADYVTALPDPIDGVQLLPEYVDAKGKADLERYRKFIQ